MTRLASSLIALVLVGGCSDSSPPPPPDADGDGDVRLMDGPSDAPFADTDGDGLCDGTEDTRGTDPTSPDTDGDGYTDYREVIYAYDPTLPEEPGTDVVHILRENPESSVQVTVTETVRGGGQDFTGAFEAETVRGTDIDAGDYHVDSVALSANPPDNVAVIEEDAETFRGVVGTTQLVFEVRFEFGDNLARLCAHAYPFRYNIKRSDGRLVGSPRFLLLVLPPDERLETTSWCAPPESCL